MKDVVLKIWNYEGDKVRLAYEDGTEVFVSKADFDRAFGCIVSAPKADVVRDFAVGEDEAITGEKVREVKA